MVEVVENLKVEDPDFLVKEVSLEEGNVSEDSVSAVETESIVDKPDQPNKRPDQEPQLPPSKWSSLTRAFHLGLAHDTPLSNSSSKDVDKSVQNETKAMDKRGSLGKMFRHGLSGSQNRPGSGTDRGKSEMELSAEAPQTIEKGNKWNIFKFGKSQHNVSESQNGDENSALKDGEKKRPLSRILHIRSRHCKEDQDGVLGASDQGRMPSADTRGNSLGKLFRHHKNPPILKNFVNCSDEPVNESTGEIALHENL